MTASSRAAVSALWPITQIPFDADVKRAYFFLIPGPCHPEGHSLVVAFQT